MKSKIFGVALVLSVGAASLATAVPYSATGAGTSIIGGGTPDYATLSAAVLAATTAGTRDATAWTFEIAGNLTEPTNSFLTVNTAPGGSITFKPSASTTPVVTFTHNLDDNPGASGNFLIGASSIGGWPTASTGTNGVIIDGSNNGTTTKDLTFTNSGITVANQSLIVIVGDTDNTIIKNVIVVNTSAGSLAGTGTIAARPRFQSAGINLTPDNWLVQNCTLTSTTNTQGVGINVTNSGTLEAGSAANGFIIRNNIVDARLRGLFLNVAYGYTVENNTVTVSATGPLNGFDTFGILNNNSNTPPANTTIIRNNTINVSNASAAANVQSPTGILMGSLGAGYDRVVEIYNNSVVLNNTGARTPNTNANIRGIGVSSGVTSRIYYNSVSIPDNAAAADNTANIAAAYGIGGFGVAASNADVRNNIVSVGESFIPAISQNVVAAGVGSGFNSDYNQIFVSGTANTGRIVTTTYATLANWQAASNAGSIYDPNSDANDPSTFWTADLHLNAVPGDAQNWGGTPVSVTTDRDGDTRDSVNPYRGADELATALVTAVHDWTMIDE